MADADTLIAKVAVIRCCFVHVDDVDTLSLWMNHCKDVLGEVFFQTFKKTNEKQQTWMGKDVNKNVDECILNSILFLHAWSVSTLSGFLIFISLKKMASQCFDICHIEMTDLLSEPTLLWFSFYGQWLTHTYLYVYLDSD